MSDWKVVSKNETGASMIAQLFTAGAAGPWYTYELEHAETGDRKKVVASDRHELGERIADGDWEEEV